jgi:hypothetical protein
VEFRFEPGTWRAAWIVSLLGLLTILAAAWIGWRRRPTVPHPGDTITSYPEQPQD